MPSPRWTGLALMMTLLAISAIDASAHVLCRRDAEITPFNASFDDTDEDPCSGTVALQGISYECGKVSDYRSRISRFLAELSENGTEFCEKYCRKRSRSGIKCRGTFTAPSRCGYTVPPGEAEYFGRTKVTCDPGCGGTALLYCSIYHGPFLSVEPKLMENPRPNCRCEKISD